MRIRVSGWLVAAGMLFLSTLSFAQVGPPIFAPPELPAYEQPVCPGDGYIWTPGYWAWDGAYYWVPGTWVMAPEIGYLWTPGYWGWGGGGYMFNEGYWGLSVGFYGGIDYGFGYFGQGYEGGRWENGHFAYNRAVSRVDVNAMHNVYNTSVNERVNRVSYNGGQGGINARATAQEESAAHARQTGSVSAQAQHAWAAHNDPQQRVSADRGSPGVSATARPNTAVHPKDLPPIERPASPQTGNAKLDQNYQKQQDKLVAAQNQDRQRLQQKQDVEYQQLAKQKADQGRTQQVQQQHQQQTQQLQERHTHQMQQVTQRQQSSGRGGSRGAEGSRGGGRSQ